MQTNHYIVGSLEARKLNSSPSEEENHVMREDSFNISEIKSTQSVADMYIALLWAVLKSKVGQNIIYWFFLYYIASTFCGANIITAAQTADILCIFGRRLVWYIHL